MAISGLLVSAIASACTDRKRNFLGFVAYQFYIVSMESPAAGQVFIKGRFPPNLTLQRTLSAPAGLSGEREIATFVLASVRQLFPESQDDLTFDYRWISRASDQLLLTLTRTRFVEQYCSVFEKAGFCIDILEIMPAALLHLPGITGDNQERALLYQGRDFWLWAVRMQHQWQYGWFYRHQYTDAGQISQVQAPALKLFFTSQTLACPSGFTKYQPLSLLSGRTPLPTYPSRFLIALGLAIRPEDG